MPDKYFGKYTGIVKDNRDPENLGRLKISIPAVFDPQETVWARPALPYGYFFVPENEDKVWAEFEGGETGLPLWTGLQYVAGEWAPEANVSPPQRRVVRTPIGHVLILSDRQGEEGIEIVGKGRVVIRALGTIEIQAPNVVINGRPVAPLPNPI